MGTIESEPGNGGSVASPELVKLLADNAADIIYRVKFCSAEDFEYDYISPAVEKILGYSPADFYADPSLGVRMIHPDDRELASNPLTVPRVLRAIGRDGCVVFLEAKNQLVFDAQGNVVAIDGVCRDVTDRIAAEEAVRRSEQNFRSLIEQSPMIIVVVQDEQIAYVNPAASVFLGVAAEQIVGRSPVALDRARRPDGSEAVAEVVTLAIEWNGAPATLAVGRDISERRQLLARLAATERLASIGTLAAGVAHEINNPLAYVCAGIELALGALGSDQPEHRQRALTALIDARDGVDRIARVVGNILTFGRPNTGATGPVGVAAAAEKAIELTRNQLRHRARLVKDLVPAPYVIGDESRLVQVFVNLLLNAAAAIPDARAADHEIRISVRPQPPNVVAEVSDTGVGIPPEQLGRVFDPFFTTKPVGAGMGLGLAICHGILTQLGGVIEVDSTVGRGTTFRIAIPASEPIAPAPDVSPRARSLSRARILFVDDEPVLCSVMSQILGQDHDVVTTTRARDALERLRAGEQFDLILCDLMMPEIDGMEFFAELRAMPSSDPERVVFMTGGAFTDRAQQFLDSIPNTQLHKPLDVTKIEDWLRRRAPFQPG